MKMNYSIIRDRATRAMVALLFISGSIYGNLNVVFADSTLCNGEYSTCTNSGYTDHNYGGNSSTSYWGQYTGHNCTNYAAYIATTNGASHPGNDLGNANQWANNAHNKGILVDKIPAVGAIAQWDAFTGGTTDSGHVAYVEAVSSDSITVSEDAWSSGPYRWRTINTGSTNWPSNFIHFKDLVNSNGGKDDIVAFEPNDGTHTSRYMQGKSAGNGQFQWGFSNLNDMQQPSSFELGDINGDNKDDIVAFEPNNGSQVSKYMTGSSNGDGTFNWGYTNLNNMSQPYQFQVGDINNDKKDDIIAFEITGANSGRYMFGLSQGNGQFIWGFTNLTGMMKPTHFALGDINGDNKDDIVAFEPNNGSQVSKYMTGSSNGDGTFNWGYTNLNNLQTPNQFEMGDINGDNKDDIVAFEPNNGSHVSRYVTASSNGNGTFNYGYTNLNNMDIPKQFEVGDINGDNKDDIVAFEPNNGSHVSRFVQGTSQGNGQFSWGFSNLNDIQMPTDFDLGNFSE